MSLAAQMMDNGMSVLATMATPAVLLLADAMLILSTNQRLQAIFTRVRETELAILGEDVVAETSDLAVLNDLLIGHARRARFAHRALLSFYSSAGLFAAVIVSLGASALGVARVLVIALASAFLGCALLLAGAVLLWRETWIGIRATDARFNSVMGLCHELAHRRQTQDERAKS